MAKEKLGNQWALVKSCHYYVMAARDGWDRRTSASAMLRALVKYTQLLEEACEGPVEPKPWMDRIPPPPNCDTLYEAANRVEKKILGSIKSGKWIPEEE